MRTKSATGFWNAMSIVLFTIAAFSAGSAAAAPAGSPWGANYFPNIALVNQDGKTVRFYDEIRDKVVLVNFIFTRCGASCPLETAKLRQVQEVLGERVGKDVFMYSISIDPDYDTPAVLKEYAQKFNVGPGWQFLTGKMEEINLLRKKLGLFEDKESRDQHTNSLIVGNDRTGQWLHRSTFDNPKVLAAVLTDRLMNYAQANVGKKSYAQAPTSIALDPGEDLFRRRCQVCHTVGAGPTVGPDLLGVTDKRDRAWLSHWLKAPDEMLAAKDPIAVALYAQYKKLSMPNLRLSDNDVEVLLGYLQAESRRVGETSRAIDEKGTHSPSSPAPSKG